MGTALLVLLLLALCGFIAYIGDLLGRRLGKKRLSVFGLRPKHTAILLTVVTGVLIAGFTFCAALVTLPWFRQVVTQGERLAAQNRDLHRANAEQTRQNDQLRSEADRRKDENTRLAGENTQLVTESRELKTASAKLKTENQGLASKNATLTRSNDELGKQAEALRLERKTLESRNADLMKTQQRLAADNRRLRLEQTALQSRQYVFRKGEQIDVRPLPPNPPEDVLRSAVDNVIDLARRKTRDRGVGPEAAILLVSPAGEARIDEARLKKWIVARAAPLRGRRVAVDAVAAENCAPGTPIKLRFRIYANERVFEANEVLAQREVNGANDDETVFGQLLSLFKLQVGPRMRAAEMPTGADGAYDFGYGPILDAWTKVKQIGGPALVKARAKKDIFKSGPFSLELEVSPVTISRTGL